MSETVDSRTFGFLTILRSATDGGRRVCFSMEGPGARRATTVGPEQLPEVIAYLQQLNREVNSAKDGEAQAVLDGTQGKVLVRKREPVHRERKRR